MRWSGRAEARSVADRQSWRRVARRLSSLWRWLRVAREGTEVDAQAAKRLHLLYRSVTADQVNTLCAVIDKASVDGMENGVSQRAQPDQPPRRQSEGRGGWLHCRPHRQSELI
jgi:hypothetical protein